MAEPATLAHRVALVTGASRGIGRAIALACAAEGAAVSLVARDREALEGVAAEVRAGGARALVCPGDVTDAAAMERAAAETEEALGPVHLLVNNAGMFRTLPFLEHSLELWSEMLRVNVMGTVVPTRAVLPAMLDRGAGRIVNVASTAGKYGTANQTAYNASKHAVVGFTRSLALEAAGRGVRVNAVCPGLVQTEMFTGHLEDYRRSLGLDSTEAVLPALLARIPIGRTVTPEEVARLVVYLASPAADGMTGQALTLSGGVLLT